MLHFVVMQNVNKLRVVMPNVIMLSVVEPNSVLNFDCHSVICITYEIFDFCVG